MSVQKQNHPSVKVAISGTSGCGKSTLFEKLLRREKPRWNFVFDHKEGDMARRFGVRPCYTADDLEMAASRGGFVIFDPAKLFPGEPERGFEFFCEWVWAVCQVLKGKKILAADELQDLVETHAKPDALCKILDQGRTFQVDCYFICQGMKSVHTRVRNQVTEIFCMIQEEKNSLEWLIERGFDGEEIKNLKHGEFLYKNKNTGQKSRGGQAFVPKNAGRDLRGL
jgi:ABC-type dipeptide/oligopeptide/nickel transport system ATPase component